MCSLCRLCHIKEKPASIIILLIRPGQVILEMDTANVISYDTPEQH